MSHIIVRSLVLFGFSLPVFAQICPTAINPAVDFFTNFNNPCYALSMPTSDGTAGGDGDVRARYSQVVFSNPGNAYSFEVTGAFPPGLVSLTVYDDHEVPAFNPFTGEPSFLTGTKILPLRAGMVNPTVVGKAVLNQQFAITVGFGALPPTSNITPGCSTAGTTADQNYLDGSVIHSGLTWLGYPGLPASFPPHQTGYNKSGFLDWRVYNDGALQPGSGFAPTPTPVVIVRVNATGCAMLASDVLAKGIISNNPAGGGPGMNGAQITLHTDFDMIQPQVHYGTDPYSALPFRSSYSYMTLANPDVPTYLGAQISASTLQSIITKQQFLLFQVKLPTVSKFPFAQDDGTAQVAYWSFTLTAGASSLYGFRASDLNPDANGMASLIINVIPGMAPPTGISGYTYLDLTPWAYMGSLTGVTIRELIPSASFTCSTRNIPPQSSEYNSVGGYMGAYAPMLNRVTAAQLPPTPVYPILPNSCGLIPTAPKR